MSQNRFATRKASLALLHPEQHSSATESIVGPACNLQFGNSRGTRLLIKPAVGGAARRQHSCHVTFCSVSAASAAGSISAPNGSHRGTDKSKVSGPDASGQQADAQPAPASLERLPVAIKRGDQLLPYVWDGKRITAMSEAALQDSDVATGRLRNWLQGLQGQLKEAFLPDPRDVTPDYWEWLRWRLTQRFFSSTMQNFSFSALLMATGLGAKKAFAASAAINWLLKDGVSRIVRMSVSTSFGQTFDADLKRMRFITSLIFTACMAGEFATPFWPQHFVALASISSVGRAVGLSAFVATQPAFQAALSTGGNLADLTSKNQAQHMVMDMLALGVSAGLTWLCRGMTRGGLLLPAIMYPLCAAGDLTCIWHELKAVQLRTLNRERAEMVIERWIRRGTVPDAAEISAAESLVLPSDVWQGLMPLRIAPLDRITPGSPEQLRELLRDYDGEEYVMHVAHRCGISSGTASPPSCAPPSAAVVRSGGDWKDFLPGWLPGGGASGSGGGGGGSNCSEQPEVLVSLSDRATPRDIAKALLHAAYLRKAVLDHFQKQPSDVHHHHHHKQVHRHNHHASLEGALGSTAPQSPEDLLHHNRHNHHNHHNHSHHHREEEKAKIDSLNSTTVNDVTLERDVDSSNHHGGNGQGNGHNGRGESRFPGVTQLLHQRHEHGHQQGSVAGVVAARGGGGVVDGAGGGCTAVFGHTHDHVHWDSRHQVLYHHSHYHTHVADPSQGHSHVYSNPYGNDCGGPLTAAARTASLSLSQGHHGNDSNGSSGSGIEGDIGACRGAEEGSGSSGQAGLGTHQSQQHHHDHHHHHHHQERHQESGGRGAAAAAASASAATAGQHCGSASQLRNSTPHGAVGRCCGPTSATSEPSPRWERLDDVVWGPMMKASRKEADRNLPRLLREAEQAGWKLKPFMLNTTERVQFVRL